MDPIMMVNCILKIFFLGDWREDRMNGKGKYVSPDGNVVEGTFEDDNYVPSDNY